MTDPNEDALVAIAIVRAALRNDIDEQLLLWDGAGDQTGVAMSLAGLAAGGALTSAQTMGESPEVLLEGLVRRTLLGNPEEGNDHS